MQLLCRKKSAPKNVIVLNFHSKKLSEKKRQLSFLQVKQLLGCETWIKCIFIACRKTEANYNFICLCVRVYLRVPCTNVEYIYFFRLFWFVHVEFVCRFIKKKNAASKINFLFFLMLQWHSIQNRFYDAVLSIFQLYLRDCTKICILIKKNTLPLLNVCDAITI